MKLRISLQCTLCGSCAAICPDGAVLRVKKRIVIDTSRCRSCDSLDTPACGAHCPAGAITALEDGSGRKEGTENE
ncbi:MAG: 4Fe-4S binding protein [Bryobacteraceae bacterium]